MQKMQAKNVKNKKDKFEEFLSENNRNNTTDRRKQYNKIKDEIKNSRGKKPDMRFSMQSLP